MDKKNPLFYLAVGNNIKKYRTIKNMSLQDIADKIGLTKKTIQRYETGEIRADMERLSEIADAIGIEMNRILEGTESFLGMNLDDIDMTNIPIVGRISCGNGALAYEDIEDYEPTPKRWLNGGDHFYLRAKGDSMVNARIYNGDLVLIRKQDDLDDGDIGVVMVEHEAYLKRIFRRDGLLILQSENPKYPIITCNPETSPCKIVGKLKKIVISV